MGAVVGDYNNDGWPDLLVTCFGGVVLYRNNGDGTFTDVTKQAGLAAIRAGPRVQRLATTTTMAGPTCSSPTMSTFSLDNLPVVRFQQNLQVPRHRRAVRSARPEGISRQSLPQQRTMARSPMFPNRTGVSDRRTSLWSDRRSGRLRSTDGKLDFLSPMMASLTTFTNPMAKAHSTRSASQPV